MTSKDPGTSEHALIDLIYRHLKKNGYKKAARALKQQVPQVQTTNVNVALEDIFQKWQSKEQETEIIEGKDPQTGSVSTTNAAHDTKPEKKLKSETIQPEARQRKRKRSKTELCKGSTPVEDHKTDDSDSDSDSSLDVEKWRRLALELSDADLGKMDAFSKSTAKSTKRQKLAQPKNHRSPKQTKARTATSRIKTDKKKQTSKKSFSSNDSDNISTPSNYAVFAEPNEKRPESTTASRLLDQCAVPKIDVSNGLSESDGTHFTHKHTKKHRLSKSHIMDTPNKKAEIEKTEHKPADSPYKKTKSKKNVSTPGRSEAPSKVTDSDITIQTIQKRGESNSPKHVLHSQTDEIKAKKDKSKKAKIGEPVGMDIFIQTDTQDATGSLLSDHSKISRVLDLNSAGTPSKNAKSKKSKKSKKHQSPGDVAMPTGECESEVYHSHSNQYQAESLSVSVKTSESEPAVKQSKKTKKSLSETNWTEKPSKEIETQAATSILEPISSEIQSKKSKTKKALEADQVHSISQKAVGDGEAMKNSSSKSDHTEKKSKKTKRRRADSSGQNVTSSETEHVSEEQYSILIPAGNGDKHQDQESGFAVNEIGTPESKRRKKKKKDKEKNKESDENVEEAPPTPPPAEECADFLPRNQKKKKKKKQKHGEEVPSMFTPGPEVDTPKKKRKFSRKNELADVSLHELI